MKNFIADFAPIWGLGFITGICAGITLGLWAYASVTP